ncbi:pantoate--beta-alanine ligase [Magnetospirillum molischianum]|uniref:Pantothenate synthetase n=1 Tax=Magnetospirillum molischianum DSM 120 TaxID=1150626 RepID=H8FX27_MAGML|nr:pantoate--beta-alanine ligase [Magnetospirillum molischianum]CCG42915.1 pantothenate synthetase (Pantoate--beta-alanine ligase) [Magnetospirillum molischianum DSM 120]
MSHEVDIVRAVADLRNRVRYWRDQGLGVALVPTMGALHQGHMSLISHALEVADRVVASIFVNPIQFGPGEDFARYPRQEAEDAAQLSKAGCHLLFAPQVAEMYPDGFSTQVRVTGLSEGLCGAARPGHFDGVSTVVSKLLLQVQPSVALFGEKDYQQLAVIRRMVRDLDIPVSVRGVEIVREEDGLALSSRNAYLTAEQRAIAPALYRVLCATAEALAAGGAASDLCPAAAQSLVAAGFDSVDYLELREADTLAPVESVVRPSRLLVAARLGTTRLIDNVALTP